MRDAPPLRLFNYGVGIHLLQSEDPVSVAEKREINPKDDHISFQVGLTFLPILCSSSSISLSTFVGKRAVREHGGGGVGTAGAGDRFRAEDGGGGRNLGGAALLPRSRRLHDRGLQLRGPPPRASSRWGATCMGLQARCGRRFARLFGGVPLPDV